MKMEDIRFPFYFKYDGEVRRLDSIDGLAIDPYMVNPIDYESVRMSLSPAIAREMAAVLIRISDAIEQGPFGLRYMTQAEMRKAGEGKVGIEKPFWSGEVWPIAESTERFDILDRSCGVKSDDPEPYIVFVGQKMEDGRIVNVGAVTSHSLDKLRKLNNPRSFE